MQQLSWKWRWRGGRSCLEHWIQTVDINGNHKRNYTTGPQHTQAGLTVHVLYTVIPCKWQLGTVLLYERTCLWALCIVQRTHAKQCHCLLEGSMLLYAHIHRRTTCTRASLPTVAPLQYPTTKCTPAQLHGGVAMLQRSRY